MLNVVIPSVIIQSVPCFVSLCRMLLNSVFYPSTVVVVLSVVVLSVVSIVSSYCVSFHGVICCNHECLYSG